MLRLKIPRDWLLVLFLVIIVCLFLNLALPCFLSGFWGTYVVQPVIWGLLVFFILRLPRYKGAGKLRLRSLLIKLAAGIAIFQIYLTLIAGFFEKFGRSPNSFTPKGIVINLVFVATSLAGIELSRAWLINRRARKPSTLLPVFIALLFTYFSLPPGQIPKISSSLEVVTEFLGSTFLPTFMENLLASFLALWGGALPALTYRGIIQAFNWFCPVLPDLNWLMKAFTGIIVPVVGLVIIQEISLAKSHLARYRRQTGKGLTGWLITSIGMVIMFWFFLGVFPVHPTVIFTGSMRPAIEVGDVVIVARVNPKLLKVGDVVQFRLKEKTIPTVHRIIDTRREGNKLLYITKGDANNYPDTEPVHPEQVTGKQVFIIPKAGWASIAVKQLLSKG